MASIEHRPNRKKKPYRVRYKDVRTGEPKNRSFKLRREAVKFQQSIESQENLNAPINPNVKVEVALDSWIDVCKSIGRNGREPVEFDTVRAYEAHVKALKPLIGATKFGDLDEDRCKKLRDDLLRDYSRKYAKKLFASFKSSLYQARTDKIIAVHPALDIHIHISSRQKQADRIVIPPMHEINQITQTIDQLMVFDDSTLNGDRIRKAWSRYGVIFYLMMFSGMRPTEIRGWPWRDLDFEKGGTSITQDADSRGEIGFLKSGAAYRWLEIPHFVLQKLATWKQFCPPSEEDLVFPNWQGNVESHTNMTNRGWYQLLKHAGLQDPDPESGKMKARYHLYTLRHIKAALEIKKNENPNTPNITPKKLQTIMGHESITMTMDLYGHLFPDETDTNPDEIYEMVKNAETPEDRERKILQFNVPKMPQEI